MTRVILRTHGGLGNQLFQVFYARTLAAARGWDPPVIDHDANYPHRFALADEFDAAGGATVGERFVSRLRLGKVGEKLGISAGILHLPGAVYLDGYFQSADLYAALPRAALVGELGDLRKRFRVQEPARSSRLTHIRLGDFFPDEEAQVQHLTERLGNLQAGDDVVTNRDDLLGKPQYAELVRRSGVHHIRTEGWSGSDMLRLMSKYRFIDTNNSTLAIWAALLGGGSTRASLERLQSVYSLLRGVAAW